METPIHSPSVCLPLFSHVLLLPLHHLLAFLSFARVCAPLLSQVCFFCISVSRGIILQCDNKLGCEFVVLYNCSL